MVARGPGDVGCAHCTKIGATQTCQVCTHLVCDRCAADWTTCSEPVGRVFRLGMGARLTEVDAYGRHGVVWHWAKSPRFFDLRGMRWRDGRPVTRAEMMALRPRLTTDGFVVYGNLEYDGESTFLRGVRWRKFDGSPNIVVVDTVPQRGFQLSTSNELAYVDDEERVVVLTPQQQALPAAAGIFAGPAFVVARRRFDPMPRLVIHSLHLTNDILVTGSWRELVIHRLVGTELERLTRLDVGLDGNVSWVALAGSTLAYAVGGRVRARRVDAAYQPGRVVFEAVGHFKSAALSVDGRHLAIGFGDNVTLYDVEIDEQTIFDEHTDAVSFIKFAADDHMLITADDDNRVIMRPRTKTGYARTLIEAKVE